MATQNERTNSHTRTINIVATATLLHHRHAQPLAYVETPDGLELADANNICLDDRCTIIEVHGVHEIDAEAADPFHDPAYTRRSMARHGETLREIVAKHVERRRCKVFREIYNDVIHDYGNFKSQAAGTRAVWRAIRELLNRKEIIPIKAAGTTSPGGYVRSDSPLLKDSDGLRFLLESLEDQYPTAA